MWRLFSTWAGHLFILPEPDQLIECQTQVWDDDSGPAWSKGSHFSLRFPSATRSLETLKRHSNLSVVTGGSRRNRRKGSISAAPAKPPELLLPHLNLVVSLCDFCFPGLEAAPLFSIYSLLIMMTHSWPSPDSLFAVLSRWAWTWNWSRGFLCCHVLKHWKSICAQSTEDI